MWYRNVCRRTYKKIYQYYIIDGYDISSQSLKIAKKKNIYRGLFKKGFERKINIIKKYDSVSMIGSMTYCKKTKFLLSLILSYLKKMVFLYLLIDLIYGRNKILIE